MSKSSKEIWEDYEKLNPTVPAKNKKCKYNDRCFRAKPKACKNCDSFKEILI